MKPKSAKHRRRDGNDNMRGNCTMISVIVNRYWSSERQSVKRLISKEITPTPSRHRHYAHWWL